MTKLVTNERGRGFEIPPLHYIKRQYVVRVVIPAGLRDAVGRGGELRQWLGPDKQTAERNAHAVIAGFLETIDTARRQLAAVRPTLAGAAQVRGSWYKGVSPKEAKRVTILLPTLIADCDAETHLFLKIVR